MSSEFPTTGRCTCGAVHYNMNSPPLFVHCCHCTWCQRETGSAFVLNALIEAKELSLSAGDLDQVATPSNSGQGQTICRCKKCKVALWSYYSGLGSDMAFLRVGTLDYPELCPPDIHIFTSTKLPWISLNDGIPAVPGYYRRSDTWPEASLARYKTLVSNK